MIRRTGLVLGVILGLVLAVQLLLLLLTLMVRLLEPLSFWSGIPVGFVVVVLALAGLGVFAAQCTFRTRWLLVCGVGVFYLVSIGIMFALVGTWQAEICFPGRYRGCRWMTAEVYGWRAAVCGAITLLIGAVGFTYAASNPEQTP